MFESDLSFIDTSDDDVLVFWKEFEVDVDDDLNCAMKVIDQIFHVDEIFNL